MTTRNAAVRLSTKDRLAMFRCAFYTKMGVVNEEKKPTDRQCIEWFQRVCAQAEYRLTPKLTLLAHPPVLVKTEKIVPEVEIWRWDAVVECPQWRDLPA